MNKSEETRIKTNDDVAKSQNSGEQMQVLRNLRSELIKQVDLQKRKKEDLIAESLYKVKDKTIIVPIYGDDPFFCSGPVAFVRKLKKRRQMKKNTIDFYK